MSVTVYSKNLSNQCNLTAQRESAQDKITFLNNNVNISLLLLLSNKTEVHVLEI